VNYDAIVIGAGANGLVAAHYLASAGKRVVVVEQRPAVDQSADIGWVPPRVIRDLGLHQLRLEQPDPWLTVPLDGGGTLELSRDIGRSVEAIRRISPADAARWPEFSQRMRTLAGVLEKLYLAPPPDIETRDPRELARIGGLGLYVRRLGKQAVIDLARILPMAIAELLDDWFESDALKGPLGALGIWHLKQGPRSGGTAFNFLHHHVGSPAGVFRPVQSNVTQTLDGMKRVEVRRGSRATVLAENGRATGVVLENGATILAPLVVSSAPPRATLQPVAIELDPEFARAVGNIKSRGVVARGTLTLGQAPAYSNLCIAPSLDYLERAYDDAKYGRASAAPYIEVQRTDGNRLELHVQYVPPGTLDGLAERVAHILKVRPDQVKLQATEESLYHGELTLDQILFMRPVPGWSRYRTPIEGLYLCGSGTHPGGGIPGAAGRNAARAIL